MIFPRKRPNHIYILKDVGCDVENVLEGVILGNGHQLRAAVEVQEDGDLDWVVDSERGLERMDSRTFSSIKRFFKLTQ